MANEIDRIMDLDPLALSEQDLDAIIAYQRKARANFEAGIKPKKGATAEPKMDANELLGKLGMIKGPAPINRRL